MIAVRPTPRLIRMTVAVLDIVRDLVEIRVVRTRFDQQHRMVWVFRKPRSKDCPGRTSSNYYRVVSA